jgi:hypothetical protein
MRKDERQQGGAEQARGSHEPQRPAPGKVTRTSELSAGRAPAVQRKAAALGTGAASQTASPRAQSVESAMDAAHRGLTALAEQGEAGDSAAPVQMNAAGGTPARPTETLAGGLWALDAQGKPLPPSLADISQGGLNDCFVFAALAAIVNANPETIRSMINDNGNGTYTVSFEGIGWFSATQQTVSADFEVGRHGNVTATKALWPLIIEKAYALQKGGTDQLDKGGNPGDAVDDFTDDGPSRFDPRDKTVEQIVTRLEKAKNDKAPVTVLAPKKEDASKEKKQMADNIPGLYFWHAYAVTDVNVADKKVKLFNPWGRDHPNGTGWITVEQFKGFLIEVNIND